MIPEDMEFYFRDFTEKNIKNSVNIKFFFKFLILICGKKRKRKTLR